MKLTAKQIVLIVIIIVVSLGLAAGIYWLLGSGEEEKAPTVGTVQESPYTCTWQKRNHHTVILQISGQLPSNAQWSVATTDGVLQVTERQEANSFSVKALAKGTGYLTLSLRQADIPVQLGADFHFSFSVDKRKNITFTNGEIVLLTVDTLTAPDGQQIYTCNGAAGSLFITVSGTGWQLTDITGLEYAGPTVTGGATRFELIAMQNAVSKTITLIEEETGRGFTLVLTQKDGVLGVAECVSAEAVSEEEMPVQPVDPEYEAFLAQLEKAETQQEHDAMIAAYWAQHEKNIQMDNSLPAESGETTVSAQDE